MYDYIVGMAILFVLLVFFYSFGLTTIKSASFSKNILSGYFFIQLFGCLYFHTNSIFTAALDVCDDRLGSDLVVGLYLYCDKAIQTKRSVEKSAF